MKALLLLATLFLTMQAFAKSSLSESDKGNGGSGSETLMASSQIILEDVSLKIKHFFIKNKDQLSIMFPEFKVQDLIAKINETTLEVRSDDILIDKHNIERTCLNFPKQMVIQCSALGLDKIASQPQALFVLVLHEYLGLLGVEETSPKDAQVISGYSISRRIAPYITKIGQYDILLKSPNLLELLIHSLYYTEEATSQEDAKLGLRTFTLRGKYLSKELQKEIKFLSKEELEDAQSCSINITTDGKNNIGFNDLRLEAGVFRSTPYSSAGAFHRNLNKDKTSLNLKVHYEDYGYVIKTKANIKDDILTFQQIVYDKNFLGGFVKAMWTEECVVDLSQQSR